MTGDSPHNAGGGVAIRVRGLVQGVGFRPTVWRLARECGLTGEVLNDGEGVLIRAWGPEVARAAFVARLRGEAPPLARIDAIEFAVLDGAAPGEGFHIVHSEASAVATGIVPDAATCPACLRDVFNSADRRHRYAFTNCTHCGPRLSIIRAIPYDRANTSMVAFPMCPACAGEYADPADRRFHAQPNACPVCGPKVWLEDWRGAGVADADPIAQAARLIEAGAIVAIKGIGGFHLACDATNAAAVETLRARKRRYGKPLALMARDATMIRRYACLSPAEEALLAASPAPIVLLACAEGAEPLAPALAPGQITLGFMLPYTPLHHLLMAELKRPIVLTSGNLSDEPQCIDNDDARARLAAIADHALMHDRDIVNRLDDLVVRVAAGASRVIRRARGYAPAPLRLPPGFEDAAPVLAMGAALKSTFCMLRGGEAVVSQHIGDLDDAATHADYRKALALYRDLYQFSPARVAVDLHPDYPSTRWGEALAEGEGGALSRVQHHHAHVAACLAEHGHALGTGPVLGVVLDGLGFGDDGTIWGGEFLLADYRGYRRLGHFAPVPMLGGDMATREPWRNAYAHIVRALGWAEAEAAWPNLPLMAFLRGKSLGVLDQMMARGLNAPEASSAGRLFDAVAAAAGVCRERASYEGQAAIELEALAAGAMDASEAVPYPFDIVEGAVLRLGFTSLWRALLTDIAAGVAVSVIAARFHKGLAAAVADMALRLAQSGTAIVLTGGVFQNRLLLEGVSAALERAGLHVLAPAQLPANDGGIALGQAVIAAASALRVP